VVRGARFASGTPTPRQANNPADPQAPREFLLRKCERGDQKGDLIKPLVRPASVCNQSQARVVSRLRKIRASTSICYKAR